MKVILCCVFLFVALCFAGRSDWSEQVIYVMPKSAYESISAKLGEDCSDYEISKRVRKKQIVLRRYGVLIPCWRYFTVLPETITNLKL